MAQTNTRQQKARDISDDPVTGNEATSANKEEDVANAWRFCMKCVPSFDADEVKQDTFNDELAEVYEGVTSFLPGTGYLMLHRACASMTLTFY